MSQPRDSQLREHILQPGSFPMLIVIGFVFFLLTEWLRPLPTIADSSITIFVLFILFVFLVKFLQMSSWFQWIFIVFILAYFIHHTYFMTPFFEREWLLYWQEDVRISVQAAIQGEPEQVSYLTRTSFFLLGLWVVTAYLYRSVVHQRKMFLFFILTIIYLAIVDTFTFYEANMAILRTFALGFFLLSFLRLYQVRAADDKKWKHQGTAAKQSVPQSSFPYPWLIAAIVFIVLVTSVGFAGPKADPAWPDPVSFIENQAAQISGVGHEGHGQRSGYGGSDEVLGGSFVQDDSVMFEAQTESRHYWRGESRDVYTGRGWESSEEETVSFAVHEAGNYWSQYGLNMNHQEEDLIRSHVQFEEAAYAQIFYPGDIEAIELGVDDVQLQLGLDTGLLHTIETVADENGEANGERTDVPLQAYELHSYEPSFSTEALLEANVDDVPAEIQEQYTQLPDELPQRVADLVHSETENIETMYEQVQKIESFFRRNDFTYEIEDVPVPTEDEDYVDQFLFETQRGYCDNFSTSMVVMLRTLDIPARWVKGFTAGEVEEIEQGIYSTIVRNKNAHAWVEVYFPDVGWVPFEPTQTFTNPYSFERDDLGDDINDADDGYGDAEHELEEGYTGDEFEGEESSAGFADSRWTMPRYLMVLMVVTVIILLILTLLLWRKVLLSWIIFRYKKGEDRQWLMQSYAILIRQLGRFVHKKEKSQTMREYVLSLEPYFTSSELRPLTRLFESVRYGPGQGTLREGSKDSRDPYDQNGYHKAYQLWLSIMKKLRA